MTRSFSINSESLSRLQLTFVNSREGCGVDHSIRALTSDNIFYRGLVRNVDLGEIRTYELVSRLQAGREVSTQHTLVSGD
jgi:hypothetical protein